MAVNREHRAGLQCVEDALAVVVRGVAQVIVLAEARGGAGLGGEGVEEGGIENHGGNFVSIC